MTSYALGGGVSSKHAKGRVIHKLMKLSVLIFWMAS